MRENERLLTVDMPTVAYSFLILRKLLYFHLKRKAEMEKKQNTGRYI